MSDIAHYRPNMHDTLSCFDNVVAYAQSVSLPVSLSCKCTLNVKVVCSIFLEDAVAWGIACSSFGPENLNFLQLWQHSCCKGVLEQKVCRQLPLHLTHTCTGRRTEDLTLWQASQSWHPSTLSITFKDTDGLKAVAKGILGQRVRVGDLRGV